MPDSESPHPTNRKSRLSSPLHQNQENVAADIHNTRTTTMRTTTIHQVADDLIGISLAMLGGNGHFRYGPLACKMLLRASELDPHFKKVTSMESVTSSISCAMKYFEDEGADTEQLQFFWFNAARYGHVEVRGWAHQHG